MPRRAPAWCAPSRAGSARLRLTCCRCAATATRWASEAWETRRENLFLLPGDLPAGSRLPLAALPHVEPQDYPIVTRADPFAERLPCPIPPPRHSPPRTRIVRTALAVEPRDGRLNVFMPYVGTLEDYLAVRGRGRSRSRANSRCRCISKATRRRPIRASTSSR